MALRDHFDRQPTEQLPAPDLVAGRYRVDERIGEGNFAVTYRAQDVVLKRTVALKMLRSEFASDQTSLARFAREARAAAAVSHPNVVPVYDYGTQDGKGFLVMAYVTGRTLKQVIAEDGPLPPVTAARLTRKLLLGLGAVHAAGIVHRDVKPQNILMSDDAIPRLTDFGIARARTDETLTAHGTTVGTVAYMAPEQIQGDPVNAATDLYSVGAVLFEMLTGRPPFEYEHPVAVMHAHLSEPPPTPSHVRSGIPRALDRVVMRALAKTAGARFASAPDMARAIDAVLPVLASDADRSKFGRASAWIGPFAFAFVALAMLGVALATTLDGGSGDHDSSQTPPPDEQSSNRAAALTGASPTATATARVVRTPTPTETQPAPPTDTPGPVATETPAPEPTATEPPTPAPTPPPSQTPEPLIVPVNNPAPTEEKVAVPLAALQFSADEWQGGYYRGDAEWYGRPWTAIYGAQSPYANATLSFSLETAPQGPAMLTITGLDDEWEGNNPIVVSVNGVEIFVAASPFPSWDAVGHGEQAAWTAIAFEIPAGVLHEGNNAIMLANQAQSASVGTPPYVLVSDALLEIPG